jgi:hypothetical protein
LTSFETFDGLVTALAICAEFESEVSPIFLLVVMLEEVVVERTVCCCGSHFSTKTKRTKSFFKRTALFMAVLCSKMAECQANHGKPTNFVGNVQSV